MKKSKSSRFDEDVRKAIESDPEYAGEYFTELMARPLPVQFALLRRYLGLTQEQVGKTLGLKQTHISRMEKEGSDHLLSFYQRAVGKLGGRILIVPPGMTLVPRASHPAA